MWETWISSCPGIAGCKPISRDKPSHPPPFSNYSLYLPWSTCMLMSCFYHLLQQDSIRSLIISDTGFWFDVFPSGAARNSNTQHSIAQKHLMFSNAQKHSSLESNSFIDKLLSVHVGQRSIPLGNSGIYQICLISLSFFYSHKGEGCHFSE